MPRPSASLLFSFKVIFKKFCFFTGGQASTTLQVPASACAIFCSFSGYRIVNFGGFREKFEQSLLVFLSFGL